MYSDDLPLILGLEILIFKISVSMYVAKITDHFEEFDSHVAKITAKLLVGFSIEKFLWHASVLLSVLSLSFL